MTGIEYIDEMIHTGESAGLKNVKETKLLSARRLVRWTQFGIILRFFAANDTVSDGKCVQQWITDAAEEWNNKIKLDSGLPVAEAMEIIK